MGLETKRSLWALKADLHEVNILVILQASKSRTKSRTASNKNASHTFNNNTDLS